MTIELLQAKNNYWILEKNRVSVFFSYFFILKIKFSYILDQDQFLTQNWDIIHDLFKLYTSIKAEYNIFHKNTYNINENKYIIDIKVSFKIIYSKYHK